MGNTSFSISEYKPENGDDLLNTISEDPNWELFTRDKEKRESYRTRLERSPSLVCYCGENFCGYVRGVLDDGFAVYISELYVKPKYRKKKIAQQLIESLKERYKDILVYILSDEDLFYEKKGFTKAGSIFNVQ